MRFNRNSLKIRGQRNNLWRHCAITASYRSQTSQWTHWLGSLIRFIVGCLSVTCPATQCDLSQIPTERVAYNSSNAVLSPIKCHYRDPIFQTSQQRQSDFRWGFDRQTLAVSLKQTPQSNNTYQIGPTRLTSRSSALNLRHEPAGFFAGLNHVHPLSRSSQAAHLRWTSFFEHFLCGWQEVAGRLISNYLFNFSTKETFPFLLPSQEEIELGQPNPRPVRRSKNWHKYV